MPAHSETTDAHKAPPAAVASPAKADPVTVPVPIMGESITQVRLFCNKMFKSDLS